jgi:hypothetical protein
MPNHHAVASSKKNDQTKFAKKQFQEKQEMCFELVDELSDVQKTTKVVACTAKKLRNHPSNICTL